MRAALDKVPRDIVFSLCQYGMGDVWKWGAPDGGNSWRTTGDITDTWGSMSRHRVRPGRAEKYRGARATWNDPDMLVVGKVGWGPQPASHAPDAERAIHAHQPLVPARPRRCSSAAT